jgi:hypothetical protein
VHDAERGTNTVDLAPAVGSSASALIERLDAYNARVCHEQRALLRLIREADARELWRDDGAHDMAHWLAMRYGVSDWKARRWIAAAHALEALPRISAAFSNGELGIDKVIELTRFAAPDTEGRLLVWARGVSSGCIRRRADREVRRAVEEAEDVDAQRFVSWWFFDEGTRFGLEAELPAAEGAVVAKTLERLANRMPAMPDEDDATYHAGARRADALVALCSGTGAGGGSDADRATVIVHASLEALSSSDRSCELEDGGLIHAETARRLLCTARLQAVVEDAKGDAVRLGQMTRFAPAWMERQIRYRDKECVFPGCGARRFTQVHHISWWAHSRRTDPDKLALVCFFHHKLVHEYRWRMSREPNGTFTWFRPDGTRYRAGPAPPFEAVAS